MARLDGLSVAALSFGVPGEVVSHGAHDEAADHPLEGWNGCVTGQGSDHQQHQRLPSSSGLGV